MPSFIALTLFSLVNWRKTTVDRRYAVIDLLVELMWISARTVLRPLISYSSAHSKAFISHLSHHKHRFYTILSVISGVLWIAQWIRQDEY